MAALGKACHATNSGKRAAPDPKGTVQAEGQSIDVIIRQAAIGARFGEGLLLAILVEPR
jgi:hypothetical protein